MDESSWALLLFENSGADDSLRPIGFLAAVRTLGGVLGPSECVLRALPWAAGIGATLLTPALASRLYAGLPARLLLVGILVLHPAAIDLSKEFKPYSISLTLHLSMMLLTLRYAELRTGRALAAVAGVAFCGMFFAQDLVFAYPGTFLVLAGVAFGGRREHLAWIVAAAALVIAGLLAQYVLIWRHMDAGESTYWGNKYGVFHTANSPESYAQWLLHRVQGLLELSGMRRKRWQSDLISTEELDALRSADAVLWTILAGVGCVALLARRHWTAATLLIAPFVGMWGFNLLGFWPMGAFRTNLFMLGYVAALAAAGFDGPRPPFSPAATFLPISLLVLIPLVAFERNWHETKRFFCYDGSFLESMGVIDQRRSLESSRRREPLVLGHKMCSEWQYYTQLHPDADQHRALVTHWVTPKCAPRNGLERAILDVARQGSRVWVIVDSHVEAKELAASAAVRNLITGIHRRAGRSEVWAFEQPLELGK